MNRVLALDTSTRWGGVALVECASGARPAVVAEIGFAVAANQADRILARVELLLAEAGWSRDAPEAYVATRGPGSFTGVRVGLGTVRGLALASGRPCVGVGTLDAVAEAHGASDRPRLVVMDAGRGEFYVGAFDLAGSPPSPTAEPRLVARGDLRQLASEPVVCVPVPGTELTPQDLPERAWLAAAPRTIAAAAGSIVLAAGLPSARESGMAPLYVRSPDALVKLRR